MQELLDTYVPQVWVPKVVTALVEYAQKAIKIRATYPAARPGTIKPPSSGVHNSGIHNMAHSASKAPGFLSSANLAAIVGLPRVSFLIVTSCALSFARRRFRSVPSRASLVFCRWSMDLSISSIAFLKLLEARSALQVFGAHTLQHFVLAQHAVGFDGVLQLGGFKLLAGDVGKHHAITPG